MDGINNQSVNSSAYNREVSGVNQKSIQRMPSYKNALNSDTVELSSKSVKKSKGILNGFKISFTGAKQPSQTEIDDAKAAFKEYQYNSDMYNKLLRKDADFVKVAGNMKEAPELAEQLLQAKKFIDKGFDVISEEVPENTTVHRLVFRNEKYPADWQIGDNVFEKGFTSTSSDPDSSFNNVLLHAHKDEQPVKIRILIPKGTKVIKGDDLMSEVLIKNGSSFKVTGYDKDTDTYSWTLVQNQQNEKQGFFAKFKSIFS